MPAVQAGLVKGVAMLSRKRLPSLPSLPTTFEQGISFAASTWFGFFLPKGTAADIVKKLHDATAKGISAPAVQARPEATGTFVVPPEHQTTEYLKSIIGPEIEKNGAPLKAAGMSIE